MWRDLLGVALLAGPPICGITFAIVVTRFATGAARRHGPVRAWTEAAIGAAAAAGITYAWGLLHLFTLDKSEHCTLVKHQPFDEAVAMDESLFPLSNPCNGTFDLVPGYVNPLLFGCLVAVLGFVALAIASHRQPRARREWQAQD